MNNSNHTRLYPNMAEVTTAAMLSDEALNTLVMYVYEDSDGGEDSHFMSGVRRLKSKMEDLARSDVPMMVLRNHDSREMELMVSSCINRSTYRVIRADLDDIRHPRFPELLLKHMGSEQAQYDFVVLDSAVWLTRPRQEENTNLQYLFGLLDLADKRGFKVVLTISDEHAKSIDSAVIRHGRCMELINLGNDATTI